MAAAPYERRRQDLIGLCHRGLDVAGFFREAGNVLRDVAPFDGCCWFTLDPATLLPTSHIAQSSIRPEDVPRLARNEYEEDDVNKFAELAHRPEPAATLRQATGGRPERSVRYREILTPNGFENELRVTFVHERAPWGGAAMYRTPDRSDFTPEQTVFLAAIAPYVAEGIRRAILIAAIPTEASPDGPGLLLVRPDNSVEAVTPAAQRWLTEMVIVQERPLEEQLPNVVHAVVSRARLLAHGGEASGGVARTRVRTVSGRWLVLHGSVLGDPAEGRAAVIIEPARPPEIAPLIVEAYGLSERERDVVQLVLHGMSTGEIAKTLFLSPYTVQDHLKAIFEKVGVHTRRELVAQVFFQHYAPRLADGGNLAADGWFAGVEKGSAPAPAAAAPD
jgi:DNA-binding CsgD family transcriptional regulator